MSYLTNPYRYVSGGLGDDEDLKAYWKCSGAGTPILNSSVSDESLGSAAQWAVTNGSYQQGSPPLNTAFEFDGGDTFSIGGTSLSQWNFMHNTSALFSIVWWMKFSAPFNDGQFFNTTQSQVGVGMGITVNPDGGFAFRIYNGAGEATAMNTTPNFIPDETTWYMFCFRYNESLPNTNGVWRRDDGNEETGNKAVASPSDDDAENPLTFGRVADSIALGEWLYAQVNEISLWNKTLSADDETELYNGGSGLEIY